MSSNTTGPGKRKIQNYMMAAALAAVLAAGLYAWRTGVLSSRPAGPLEKVTIATTEYAGTCAVFAAQEKGYFENEGVNAEIKPYTTGKAALAATMRGEADLGTSAELPIIFAAIKEQPAVVIATLVTAEKDYGIVARKDKGIATPDSLKGKQIGVTIGTSAHFALDAFLNRQKLAATDVTRRDLKPEGLADAMAKGDIDAASTWEPYLGKLRKQLGDNATTFSLGSVYDSLYSITGTRDYVANRPETVKKVLRALVRGGRYCKESPQEAIKMTAKIIMADEAKLQELWPSYRFDVSLDQGLLLALEDQTRWAAKNGLIDKTGMPNYLNYVHLDTLKAVAPAAVTVIH